MFLSFKFNFRAWWIIIIFVASSNDSSSSSSNAACWGNSQFRLWGSFVTAGRCGKIQILKLMVGFADCEGCPFPILLEIDLAKQQSRNPPTKSQQMFVPCPLKILKICWSLPCGSRWTVLNTISSNLRSAQNHCVHKVKRWLPAGISIEFVSVHGSKPPRSLFKDLGYRTVGRPRCTAGTFARDIGTGIVAPHRRKGRDTTDTGTFNLDTSTTTMAIASVRAIPLLQLVMFGTGQSCVKGSVFEQFAWIDWFSVDKFTTELMVPQPSDLEFAWVSTLNWTLFG